MRTQATRCSSIGVDDFTLAFERSTSVDLGGRGHLSNG